MTSWAYISHTKLTNIDGVPYIGAKAYFYDAGTTTPRIVYSDSALTTAITQPAVADANGKFGAIYVQAGVYKIKVTQSDDTLIYEQDNVDPGVASNVSGAVPIANGGTAGTTAATARANLGAASQTGLDALTASTTTSLAGKSNTGHTHVIADVTDSTTVGKAVVVAATAAAARTAIGASAVGSSVLTATDAAAGRYAVIALGVPDVEVEHQVSSGSGAGVTVVANTWTQRPLNTTIVNTLTGASIASNRVTLPTGTYHAEFIGQIGGTAARSKIYNVTDSADIRVGMNCNMRTINMAVYSFVTADFTITSPKQIEVQSSCFDAGDRFGIAVGISGAEVFANLRIWKVA
jgi:hypothetical protein